MSGAKARADQPPILSSKRTPVIIHAGHSIVSVLWVVTWLALFRLLIRGEFRTPLLVLLISYAIAVSVMLARAGYRSQSSAHDRPAPNDPQTRSTPARLLVIGATGGTGQRLVAQALERGHFVTALVRDPSKLRLDHERLTVIHGDVLDYSSVEAAMRGQEAVVCALGHKRFFYPTRILSEGTRNILRAMETHHVARLVCETSLGIGDSAGRLGLYFTLFTIPVILPFYFRDKCGQERMIAESNVQWVIVRPGMLTNAGKSGRFRHGPRAGNFLWTMRISRSDVADFMLDQLSSDQYLRSAASVAR